MILSGKEIAKRQGKDIVISPCKPDRYHLCDRQMFLGE